MTAIRAAGRSSLAAISGDGKTATLTSPDSKAESAGPFAFVRNLLHIDVGQALDDLHRSGVQLARDNRWRSGSARPASPWQRDDSLRGVDLQLGRTATRISSVAISLRERRELARRVEAAFLYSAGMTARKLEEIRSCSVRCRFATARARCAPRAGPVLTITGWPSSSAILGASSRARTFGSKPPGANGTRIRIGFGIGLRPASPAITPSAATSKRKHSEEFHGLPSFGR